MFRKAAHYLTLGYVDKELAPELTLNDVLLHAKLDSMDKYDEGDYPEPAPATSEIEQLKALLRKEGEEIVRQRDAWQARLRLLNKLDAVHPDHVHQAACEKEMQHNKSALREFFDRFTGFFHTAKTAMDDQLKQEMDGHVLALEAHMEHLMAKANQTEQSSDAHRDALMHISNAAIIILGELDNLTKNFAAEIEECIKNEQAAEQKAQILINAGIYYIQNLLNIIIPPVNIEFGKEYLNFLGQELEEPEGRYIAGMAQAEGILDKAARMTDSSLQPYRSAQFDTAAKKYAGAMTLFAGKAVERAEEEQLADKQFEQDVRAFINM